MIRFDTKKDMDYYDNLHHKIYEKDKEIERLNNIINEMENYINYNLDYWNKESSQRSSYIRETLTNTLDTLRKLKGSDKDVKN